MVSTRTSRPASCFPWSTIESSVQPEMERHLEIGAVGRRLLPPFRRIFIVARAWTACSARHFMPAVTTECSGGLGEAAGTALTGTRRADLLRRGRRRNGAVRARRYDRASCALSFSSSCCCLQAAPTGIGNSRCAARWNRRATASATAPSPAMAARPTAGANSALLPVSIESRFHRCTFLTSAIESAGARHARIARLAAAKMAYSFSRVGSVVE
jgi:hypothetical protein